MNYLNKIQLPENISSIDDVNENYNQHINDLITYLFKNKRFKIQSILKIYRAYFTNTINRKIQNNYIYTARG